MGVHGDWGAGKSSVLEMVEDGLSKDKKVLCLKFNGWQFQGFEDAKIALIEGVLLGLIENRSLWSKATDEVKEALKSVDKLKLAKKAGTLAFSAVSGIPAFGFDELLGSASMGEGEGDEQRGARGGPQGRSRISGRRATRRTSPKAGSRRATASRRRSANSGNPSRS